MVWRGGFISLVLSLLTTSLEEFLNLSLLMTSLEEFLNLWPVAACVRTT